MFTIKNGLFQNITLNSIKIDVAHRIIIDKVVSFKTRTFGFKKFWAHTQDDFEINLKSSSENSINMECRVQTQKLWIETQNSELGLKKRAETQVDFGVKPKSSSVNSINMKYWVQRQPLRLKNFELKHKTMGSKL